MTRFRKRIKLTSSASLQKSESAHRMCTWYSGWSEKFKFPRQFLLPAVQDRFTTLVPQKHYQYQYLYQCRSTTCTCVPVPNPGHYQYLYQQIGNWSCISRKVSEGQLEEAKGQYCTPNAFQYSDWNAYSIFPNLTFKLLI